MTLVKFPFPDSGQLPSDQITRTKLGVNDQLTPVQSHPLQGLDSDQLTMVNFQLGVCDQMTLAQFAPFPSGICSIHNWSSIDICPHWFLTRNKPLFTNKFIACYF